MTTDIYLDGNATSAVLPAAIAAATQAMADNYGNPSSSHATGLRAKAILDGARRRARALLGVGDGRLMFNSGATEGIQTAILSALCALRERPDAGRGLSLVYGATEHKAVPEALAHWNRLLGLNLDIVRLAVDGQGRHDLDHLRALAPRAALVCTMAANNETGVISDLAGIGAVLEHSAAYWLVDCVQALGKLALNLAATRIDYAPFSGHKLYAPKGIGMLYVRAGAPFTPLMTGGGQESGLRSGTENVAGIAALGAVLALLEDGAAFRDHATLSAYRARLADSLRDALPGVVFNMLFAGSLPTTLNFSVPDLSSKELLDLFDAAGVRVSAGSACSAAKSAPSYVLEAMGLPEWRSGAAVRLSYGPAIDEAAVDAACERIARCGAALRSSGLISPDPRPAMDAVTRLEADGACGWLITDAGSRSCVLIDPPPAFIPRLAAKIRSQDLRVRAVLHTGQPGDEGAALLAALGQVLQPADAGAAVALGARTLARVARPDGGAVYLLGSAEQIAASRPRFAFTGTLDATALGDAAIGPDTLLCGGTDDGVVCTTLGKKEVQAGVASLLAAAELGDFIDRHPDALLVDVREAHEHAAAGAPLRVGGKTAHSVPLSQLAGELEQWLAAPSSPLVFFCRSGNRSGKAVASLRRLGHASAWHIAGGIAAL